MSDEDLQAISQGYIDSTRLLIEIAELVGIEGVIHGPEVLTAIESLLAEKKELGRELERERIASEMVAELRGENRLLRTVVDRLRAYQDATRRLSDIIGDGDTRQEEALAREVSELRVRIDEALVAVEGEV